MFAPDGSLVRSDQERAELLVQAFSTVFAVYDGNIPPVDTSHLAPPLEFGEINFPRYEICKLLEGWKRSACSTPDQIDMRFVKNTAVPIAHALEFIFTRSFATGEVPSLWKMSLVTPVKKKPPFSDPLNYRPISITSLFCRVFEKMLSKPIVHFCDRRGIIPDQQFGFRAGRLRETFCLTVSKSGLVLSTLESLLTRYTLTLRRRLIASSTGNSSTS